MNREPKAGNALVETELTGPIQLFASGARPVEAAPMAEYSPHSTGSRDGQGDFPHLILSDPVCEGRRLDVHAVVRHRGDPAGQNSSTVLPYRDGTMIAGHGLVRAPAAIGSPQPRRSPSALPNRASQQPDSLLPADLSAA